MEKTLELIFTKNDGAKKTLSIADPREDVTLAEAQAAAAKIIEAGVLTSGGLGLNEFVEAPDSFRVMRIHIHCLRTIAPAGGNSDSGPNAFSFEFLCASSAFGYTSDSIVCNNTFYRTSVTVLQVAAD